MGRFKVVLLAGACLLAPQAMGAQQPSDDLPINAVYRAKVLDAVASALGDSYVFADRASFIRKQLSKKAVRARYDTCATGASFASALTKDLAAWSQDRHVRMFFSAKPRPMPTSTAASAESREKDLETARARNFGFHQVERLTGNVGYLEIGRFDPPSMAAPTAIAAMQFLANTDALIIDLRNNGGGRADMVAFLASYFLDEQTKLATLERRAPNTADQIWSSSYVPGERYVKKPIYILTSKRTFSGAEGLAYDLKHFAQAIIVGEQTRGGANPGGIHQIDEHFAVGIPTARVVHAATGTNWDASGIAPDVSVAVNEAKPAAHKLALQKLISTKATDARMAMWQGAMTELFEKPAPGSN